MIQTKFNAHDPFQEQREAYAERFANMVTRAAYEQVPPGQGRCIPATGGSNSKKLVRLGYEQGFIDALALFEKTYAKELELGELEFDRQEHEKELQAMKAKSSITIGADHGKVGDKPFFTLPKQNGGEGYHVMPESQEVQFHGPVKDAEAWHRELMKKEQALKASAKCIDPRWINDSDHPTLQDIREEEPEGIDQDFEEVEPESAPAVDQPNMIDLYVLIEGKYSIENDKVFFRMDVPDGAGFTSTLDDAKIYTKEQAQEIAKLDSDYGVIAVSLWSMYWYGKEADKRHKSYGQNA